MVLDLCVSGREGECLCLCIFFSSLFLGGKEGIEFGNLIVEG